MKTYFIFIVSSGLLMGCSGTGGSHSDTDTGSESAHADGDGDGWAAGAITDCDFGIGPWDGGNYGHSTSARHEFASDAELRRRAPVAVVAATLESTAAGGTGGGVGGTP